MSRVWLVTLLLGVVHCWTTTTTTPALRAVHQDEALGYLEFLKAVSDDVENILENSFGTSNNKDTIIKKTTGKVVEIREKILERIKKLRRGAIRINQNQDIQQDEKLSGFRKEIMNILMTLVNAQETPEKRLKDVSSSLLDFRRDHISAETTRIIKLESGTNNVPDAGCEIEENVNRKVSNLIDCAKSEGKKTDCQGTDKYATVILSAIDVLDDEITKLYKSSHPTDVDKNQKNTQKRENFGKIRKSLEEVLVTNLIPAKEEEKIKNIVYWLREPGQEIEKQLNNCKGEGEGCDTWLCGAKYLKNAKEKLESIKTRLEKVNGDEEERKEKKKIRKELLADINEKNKANLNILRIRAEGPLEKCQMEKKEAFDFISTDLWKLVEEDDKSKLLDELTRILDKMTKKIKKCADNVKTSQTNNCEESEYQQAKVFLTAVDKVKESLFRGEDLQAVTAGLLGFVDIQAVFDRRITELYQDLDDNGGVRCADEKDNIRNTYMKKLKECREKFIGYQDEIKTAGSSALSRTERVECIQTLWTNIDTRKNALLTILNKFLEPIVSGASGSGTNTG